MTTSRTSLDWTALLTAALTEEAAVSRHLLLAIRLTGASLVKEGGRHTEVHSDRYADVLHGLIRLTQYGKMSCSLILDRIAAISKHCANAKTAGRTEGEAVLLESIGGHRQSVLELLLLAEWFTCRMPALRTGNAQADTSLRHEEKLAAELLGSALRVLELVDRLKLAGIALFDGGSAEDGWKRNDPEWRQKASAIVGKCRHAVFRHTQIANEYFTLLQQIGNYVTEAEKTAVSGGGHKSKPANPTIFIKKRGASKSGRSSRE
ncbi:hypothetical protein [Paenibacillus contaminans]|uniref:Uncharacterized protein n=1 Tax=Paenibacillus contaminans TaxID=450362 RepID=A0A329MVK3_9BACL|nr:hypothetical protein [Paenibacillus contaminans]RAV22926.1 hypothetical protein DQG23_01600 [Paenibacillus contaminans]